MKIYPHLPDSELIVMQIIWAQPVPISKTQVAAFAEPLKGWKHQTVYTLLKRLTEKGFLFSEKIGKERYYSFLVSQQAYLNQETGRFLKTVHKSSLIGLMNALFADNKPNAEDLSELEQWLKEQSKGMV